MFTGIVEEVAEVRAVRIEGSNRHLTVRARMAPELKVDQSVAHNGVCLTVVAIEGDTYTVTAVEETLQRSNLGQLQPGDPVNLERSLRLGDRLDGHMVQGHVDTMTTCVGLWERDGSWTVVFALPEQERLLVPKGSICLNGVSLTIAALDAQTFSVAIIPYTFAHTTFQHLRPGMAVNVEYDVLGKYVERMMAGR
jgi:riboflavin synthase